LITSRSNPQVKLIRKLRNRKDRHELGLYFSEGLRIVTEAITQKQPIEFIIASPELLISEHGKKVLAVARNAGLEILEVSKDVFEDISNKDGPQGLATVIRITHSNITRINIQPGDLWLALDSIQDPGNLGTILRTMDAVGGAGVILLDHCTDVFDPKVVRASMGALFTVPVFNTELQEFTTWAVKQGIPIYGADGDADIEYTQVGFHRPLILLMGSEKQGLQARYLNLCAQVIKIPMIGKMDSLNLSAASAIILYEIFNQTRERPES
jgi:TrmH family RNA methyltransferase